MTATITHTCFPQDVAPQLLLTVANGDDWDHFSTGLDRAENEGLDEEGCLYCALLAIGAKNWVHTKFTEEDSWENYDVPVPGQFHGVIEWAMDDAMESAEAFGDEFHSCAVRT